MTYNCKEDETMRTLANRLFVAAVVVSLPWLASVALAGVPPECAECWDEQYDCWDGCLAAYDECTFWATTQTEMDACQTEYEWCFEECQVEREACFDQYGPTYCYE